LRAESLPFDVSHSMLFMFVAILNELT
jgi:hypothetical protein